MRVPMIVVSPWSKGGWVNSQLFDHTSLIRFIEARYAREVPGLFETNITPWRRAVTGDLTSTLDFSSPPKDRVTLPSTAAFLPPDLVRHPDLVIVPPASQQLPAQEPGVRPARALPYVLHADGQAQGGSFRISFGNTGDAAAVFHVRSGNAADAPRNFTVEPQRMLSDAWAASPGYDLSVHGPNGFLRAFKGSVARDASQLLIRASYDTGRVAITLSLTNMGTRTVDVNVRNAYRGKDAEQKLEPRRTTAVVFPLERSGGWYDLSITIAGDAAFAARFAGHVETGADSISDPAMGRVRLKD
jgi:phospholipase C